MHVALRSLLFTVFIPGGLTVGMPYLLLGHELSASSAHRVVAFTGIVMVILGAAMYLGCVWEFTFTGRGTPAIWDPPIVFVSMGLYRYVRNPMYMSILGILFGEAVLFQSRPLLMLAAGAGIGFHMFVVFYEEPALTRKFGFSYQHYCKQVGRWLPRWRHEGSTS